MILPCVYVCMYMRWCILVVLWVHFFPRGGKKNDHREAVFHQKICSSSPKQRKRQEEAVQFDPVPLSPVSSFSFHLPI